MFFHSYKMQILRILRCKDLVFWTFLFPLALATLFFFTIGNMQEGDAFSGVPTAVVADEELEAEGSLNEVLQAVSGKEDALLVLYSVSDTAEADALLKEKTVDGYLSVRDGVPVLTVSESGISQTILKSFLDRYLQIKEMVAEAGGAAAGAFSAKELFSSESYISEGSLSDTPPSDSVNFFYALLAMVCMYAGFSGMDVSCYLKANLSPQGMRRLVSPAGKWKMLIFDLLATFTVQYAVICLMTVYMRFVLDISFGDQLLFVFLTGLIGGLAGVSFGCLLGAIGRMSMSVRTALYVCISMVCCFFAGLMTTGINYLVEQSVPILAWINPAARIADAFYCLYYCEVSGRYFLDLGALLLMAVFGFLLSIFLMRRDQYENL